MWSLKATKGVTALPRHWNSLLHACVSRLASVQRYDFMPRQLFSVRTSSALSFRWWGCFCFVWAHYSVYSLCLSGKHFTDQTETTSQVNRAEKQKYSLIIMSLYKFWCHRTTLAAKTHFFAGNNFKRHNAYSFSENFWKVCFLNVFCDL